MALQVNEDEYKKVRATHTSATLMKPSQRLILSVVVIVKEADLSVGRLTKPCGYFVSKWFQYVTILLHELTR